MERALRGILISFAVSAWMKRSMRPVKKELGLICEGGSALDLNFKFCDQVIRREVLSWICQNRDVIIRTLVPVSSHKCYPEDAVQKLMRGISSEPTQQLHRTAS